MATTASTAGRRALVVSISYPWFASHLQAKLCWVARLGRGAGGHSLTHFFTHWLFGIGIALVLGSFPRGWHLFSPSSRNWDWSCEEVKEALLLKKAAFTDSWHSSSSSSCFFSLSRSLSLSRSAAAAECSDRRTRRSRAVERKEDFDDRKTRQRNDVERTFLLSLDRPATPPRQYYTLVLHYTTPYLSGKTERDRKSCFRFPSLLFSSPLRSFVFSFVLRSFFAAWRKLRRGRKRESGRTDGRRQCSTSLIVNEREWVKKNLVRFGLRNIRGPKRGWRRRPFACLLCPHTHILTHSLTCTLLAQTRSGVRDVVACRDANGNASLIQRLSGSTCHYNNNNYNNMHRRFYSVQ